ncbi:MAG: branched-chain amino acid ABC transporter permease [Bacteroidetes bacterium]|nr:branched-chain amino acid ABC transporter permease [Bacteroidota bacterium]
MEYVIHIGIVLGLYMILVASAQLVIGHARLISLGQGAFFGTGAYVTALCMLNLGWSFFPALLTAVVLNAVIGLLLALPAVRLKGDYFVLTTLGFQFIIFQLTVNLDRLTGGPAGLGGIPSPSTPQFLPISQSGYLFVVTLILVIIAFTALFLLQKSRFGRNLKALCDHELLYEISGRSPIKLRAQVIAVSAATTALASAVYAVYMSYLAPGAFNLDQSIFILTGVMLGGLSRLRQAVVGALVIVLFPELMRAMGLPATYGPSMNQVFFGLVLLVLVSFTVVKRFQSNERRNQ